MDIYLGWRLPASSCGLPGDDGEPGCSRPKRASLLLDLAPHGGCLAGDIAAPAGGLLHHPFTLTHPKVSGLLSVALFQTFTRFRALPGMLPCGVRTFLGRRAPASIRLTWSSNPAIPCAAEFWTCWNRFAVPVRFALTLSLSR